jgi:hypothetical protein
MPFLVSNLNSHLLSKYLFFNSSTSIPRSPWSFGLYIIFHFVSLYFFLVSSDCQKNLDQKKSNRFLTPTDISKKDSKSINYVLPPYKNIRYFSFMKLMYLDIF